MDSIFAEIINDLNLEFTKRYSDYMPDWTDAYKHIFEHLSIETFRVHERPSEKVCTFWSGITNCFKEYIGRKGKGLRPLLFLASYMAASGRRSQEIPDDIWDIAFAIEMFNSAALASDDVLDGGKMRRGGKSLPCLIEDLNESQGIDMGIRFGLGQESTKNFSGKCVAYFTAKAIEELWLSLRKAIVGIRYDHMYYTNWPKCTDHPLWLFANFTAVTNSLSNSMAIYSRIGGVPSKPAIGKEYDLLSCCLEFLKGTLDGEKIDYWWSNPDKTEWIYNGEISMPSVDEVLWLQRMKTTLYSVKFPLIAGALLADNASFSIVKYLEVLALSFGEAFQIYDDLLVALPEENTGKSSLSDLINGSRTIVTVGVYELLENDEKKSWIDLLEKCKVSEEARTEALSIICHSGIIEKCNEMIKERMASCEHSVQELSKAGYVADLPWRLLSEGIHWMDDGLVESIGRVAEVD